MEDPKAKANSRAQNDKDRKKTGRKLMPEDAMAAAEGGFMLTTSEILDFSEGTDSTP